MAFADARGQARVVANRARVRAGRTTAVALVQRTAYGGTVATTIQVVLKQRAVSVPQVEDQTGAFVGEWLAEIQLADVSDPSVIAYIALTPNGATDATSLAAATVLEVVQFRLSGIVPDRWQVSLRRLR